MQAPLAFGRTGARGCVAKVCVAIVAQWLAAFVTTPTTAVLLGRRFLVLSHVGLVRTSGSQFGFALIMGWVRLLGFVWVRILSSHV